MSPNLAALRTEMRRRRRALTAEERAHAAHDVAALIARQVRAGCGARVGAYLSVGAELDTGPLLALAQRRGWRIFVPAILSARGCRMRFVPLEGPLRRNRFGIAEPARGAAGGIDPRWLDLVFVPLLAAGPAGERLGSGAGFYDRAFGYRLRRRTWRKPRLIGLAYDFQRVAALPRQSWDVPLDALITERTVHRFASDPP